MKKVSTSNEGKGATKKKKTVNGAKKSKRPQPSKPTVPELPEGLIKLTLKAFQKTYDAHHGKS